MSKSYYEKLKLTEPSFGSYLTDLIIELDFLRKKELQGSTHPRIFVQLKGLFHTLESLSSSRIEGNHTTVAEFIEVKLEQHKTSDEKILEIENLEKALEFIDSHATKPIDEDFVKELHKMVVNGLSAQEEGDSEPGEYRGKNNKITGAKHTPPEYTEVKRYMKELIEFMDQNDPPKYDLIKIALFHHRFLWIHPFNNGNGRTVRLLTYAQLIKAGFKVSQGIRIINPTAIFCNDREKYYNNLANADFGNHDPLVTWCEYVLMGLKREIEKIDSLLDHSYLSEHILLPAINFSLERKIISLVEADILRIAVRKQRFQASDLKSIFPDKLPQHISREINNLKNKNMIVPEFKNSRKYVVNFTNNYLLRGVIKMLDANNFLPLKGEV